MIHITPVNDLIEHIEDTDCPCGPEVDVDNGIVVHAAMDRRECFEEPPEPVSPSWQARVPPRIRKTP